MSCETREERQEAIREAAAAGDAYRRWHDDHAAELEEALREVLGWAGWQVREMSVDALTLRVRARGHEVFVIARHDGGWIVGGEEGVDLVAMLRRVCGRGR